MTHTEFLKVVVYIELGIGKVLTANAKDVYFDCLGDLTYDVLFVAAKRVIMEHKWATFPSVAELREAAAETLRGAIKDLSPAEAWQMAWRVAGQTDPEIDGSFARATKTLPPLVVEAIRTYGLNDLCYGREPVGVVRGQFMKIFEQLAAREKRRALLPESLKAEIENAGRKQPAAITATRSLAEHIGQPA